MQRGLRVIGTLRGHSQPLLVPRTSFRSIYSSIPTRFPRVASLKLNPELQSTRAPPPAPPPESDESIVRVLSSSTRSLRPILFAAGVTVAVYAWAADSTNKDSIKYAQRVRLMSIAWNPIPPTTIELMNARSSALKDKLVRGLNRVKSTTRDWSKGVAVSVQQTYVILANTWLALPEGKRTCYGIAAVNALIFVGWQIPRLQGFMKRHFLHDPLSGKSYTLLTSIFSHQSFLHFLFNTLALTSFGAAFEVADGQRAVERFIPQSTDRYHFLAFFVGAGLFASALSYVVATRVRLPRILSALSNPLTAASMTRSSMAGLNPSLGASGAIYGVVAMVALGLPETHIQLIFLPFFNFPISYGLVGMMGLDILGIIRGWRMFDHWAHLGGAIAGISYFWYAPWEKVRTYFAKNPLPVV